MSDIAAEPVSRGQAIHNSRDNLFVAFCIGISILLWAVYTLPWSFAAELNDDTVVFSYIAQRMLAGDVLYRDVWDHKGPLIFMLDALGLWLGGGSYGGIKAIEFLLMAAAVTLLYLALKPFTGKTFAALVPLLITVAIRVPMGEGNFTEEYAIFLQAAAILCIIRLEDKACRRPALYAFLIGLAGACAFFFRANLIGLWLTLGLYWTVKAFIGKDIRSFVKNCIWALLPIVLTSAAFVAYFGWHGALSDFLEGFIFHNIRYSQEVSMPFAAKTAKILALGQSLYPFLPLCVIGCIMLSHGWRKGRYPLVLVFVPVWFVVEMLLSSLAGYPYPHYVITWLLPMASLAVLVVYRLAMRLTGSLERPSAGCLAALAIVAAGMVMTAVPAFRKAMELYGQRDKMTFMTKYIAENSKEGETVYFYESFDAKNDFFGAKSLSPLFFANRKLPTPYVYSSFYLPGNEQFRQKMVDALYDGWTKSPPALVIFLPKKEDSFWFLIDQRIEEMVKKDYRQAAELDGFLIYKPNLAD